MKWREALDRMAAESPSPDSIHLGWWGFWFVVCGAFWVGIFVWVTG